MITHGDKRFWNPTCGTKSFRNVDFFGNRIDLTFEKKTYF